MINKTGARQFCTAPRYGNQARSKVKDSRSRRFDLSARWDILSRRGSQVRILPVAPSYIRLLREILILHLLYVTTTITVIW